MKWVTMWPSLYHHISHVCVCTRVFVPVEARGWYQESALILLGCHTYLVSMWVLWTQTLICMLAQQASQEPSHLPQPTWPMFYQSHDTPPRHKCLLPRWQGKHFLAIRLNKQCGFFPHFLFCFFIFTMNWWSMVMWKKMPKILCKGKFPARALDSHQTTPQACSLAETS